MNLIYWLNAHFSGFKPDKKTARKAIRHLKKKEKKQLFSNDLSQMRAAEGRWYESLIYEMLLEISGETDKIDYVIRKGADAPFPAIEIKPGQNGLYYSNRGDINIRGNGQDIAEIDILLVDGREQVVFAEIVTSASDLKELEEEVYYKKRLLGYLFGQATVPFILFSSVDISRSSIIKRLVHQTESTLIVTDSCEELKTLLKSSSIRGVPRKPIHHKKLMSVEKLQPKRAFDYKKLHDLRRNRTLKGLENHENIETLKKRDEIPPIAKKILFGALQPVGIKSFWGKEGITIKDKHYSCEKIMEQFSKVILAVDLPGYEPVIYMRIRNKKEYLKVVPKKSGGYRIENKRTPRMTGFFLWLETLKPTIGANLTEQYMKTFLPNKPVNKKKQK